MEPLRDNPLYVALTRPAMVMGITIDYLSTIIIATLCLFIMISNSYALMLYPLLHLFGLIACQLDHNIFNLLIKKIKIGRIKNKSLYGVNCYAPF